MADQERNVSSGHEHYNADELEKIRDEQRDQLKQRLEHEVTPAAEHEVESARHEALEKAVSSEREKRMEKTEKDPTHEHRPLNKREKNVSFDTTMREARSQMPAASRVFSSIIHNPAVEKISDVAGGTIARPNAILSGSVFAFLFTLVIYLTARYYGYPLSGTETIAAFLLGWIVGLIIDYLRLIVFGKK